ncbi:hypothetical protein GCM10007967_26550 [Xylanimonas ulmi]
MLTAARLAFRACARAAWSPVLGALSRASRGGHRRYLAVGRGTAGWTAAVLDVGRLGAREPRERYGRAVGAAPARLRFIYGAARWSTLRMI